MAGASTRSAWLSAAPWGAGGGSSRCYRTLGCSEIRPVTVQNWEFPPLRGPEQTAKRDGAGGGSKQFTVLYHRPFCPPKCLLSLATAFFSPREVCCPQPQHFLPPRKSAVHSHRAFYYPESLLSAATAFFTTQKVCCPQPQDFLPPQKACCPQPQRFLPLRKSNVPSHRISYPPESLLSSATGFCTPQKVCCPQPQDFLTPRKPAIFSHSAIYPT